MAQDKPILAKLDGGVWAILSWLHELYRLGQRVVPHGESSAVQHELLNHIVRGFQAHSGSLALTNGDGETLTLVTGIEIPEHVIGKVIRFGEGIMGRVAAEGEPLLLNGDVSRDPRFGAGGQPAPREGSRRSYHSSLCWPLKVDQSVIGVLSINRAEGQHPFTNDDLDRGTILVSLISVVVENTTLHADQQDRIRMLSELNQELKETNRRLDEAQAQLVQSEKMASIGQLAAGLAHEINTPIGFIGSNLSTFAGYLNAIIDWTSELDEIGSSADGASEKWAAAQKKLSTITASYPSEDVRALIEDCIEGIKRVRQIVQDMRVFSRLDQSEWQFADLHEGIDSTLNIVANELRHKCEVIKEYGELPRVECLAAQINQVIMNLLVNAAHAITDHGTIKLATGVEDDEVWIGVSDSGEGIPAASLSRIFDPFFTTKPVGSGTGLGLSVSYGIVEKHHGRIEVESTPGSGTTFRVWLPVRQTHSVPAAALAETKAEVVDA